MNLYRYEFVTVVSVWDSHQIDFLFLQSDFYIPLVSSTQTDLNVDAIVMYSTLNLKVQSLPTEPLHDVAVSYSVTADSV